MKRSKLLRIALVTIVLMIGGNEVAHAQSRQRLRELEKKEQERQAEADAKENEAMERHLSIQSKRTRKEMKRYKKQSKRYNRNRKEPFFKKWFRKK